MYTLRLLAASLVLQFIDRRQVVRAQTTQAVCTPAHSWMSNSKGQNPCLVAAYLHLPCAGGQNTNVDAMTQPSQYYTAQNDLCQCNMVSYAMFEACQNCQFDNGTTVTSYSRFTLNCTTQNTGYPETLPVGTAVPAWAYQDVSTTDFFNLTVAARVAAEEPPDSTAAIPTAPTSSIATRSASGTVADSLTTQASSSSNLTSATASGSGAASSGSHSIVGPVVGGVVGGVVGALALGALVFYFLRRRSPRAALYPGVQTAEAIPSSPGYPTPTPKSGGFEPWQTAPLLYDPEDPRTYPTVSPGGGPPPSMVTSTTLVQPASHTVSAYKGTAEL